MKIKDLDTTTEYLACSVNSWRTNTYTGTGHGATKRVRVIEAPGTWRYNTTTRQYDRAPQGSFRTSTGALVALLDIDTGEPTGRNDVVTLASIRGPWGELWPGVMAEETARVERVRADRAARDAATARILAALEVVEYRTGLSKGFYPYDTNAAVINVDVLEAVAALLEDRR